MPADPPDTPTGSRDPLADPLANQLTDPLTDLRAALSAVQAGLLAALVAGAPAPPGFDAERVRQQAGALLAKRAANASTHFTWLAEALGDDYLPYFARYAEARPKPAGSTALDDAAAFETYLRDTDALPRRPRAPRWPRARRK